MPERGPRPSFLRFGRSDPRHAARADGSVWPMTMPSSPQGSRFMVMAKRRCASFRECLTPRPVWIAACPSCFAAFRAFAAADLRSIRWPRSASLGERRLCAAAGLARHRARPVRQRDEVFAIRRCRPVSIVSFCVDSRRTPAVPNFGCGVTRRQDFSSNSAPNRIAAQHCFLRVGPVLHSCSRHTLQP